MGNAEHNSLHIVAIAGGSGTRFWPLSRHTRPKQLLTVADEATLLGATFARSATLAPPERWWMVVGAAHADACRRAVPAVPSGQTLVEPVGRNTAPAVALAAIAIGRADPDAVMAVLPADHHVADGAALASALEQAAAVARTGAIVTLGITPTYPETGYGYIERGEADARGGYGTARFCEKPDLETAQRFHAAGSFSWNAGMFVLRPDTFLAELRRQRPETFTAFERLADHLGTPAFTERLESTYAELESISIDYAIMENAEDVVVIPVECGWTDVGGFKALADLGAADPQGNVTEGRVVAIDSQDCLVRNDGEHVVALVGVSDLVVVHTADATLVIPKDRAQDVRQVVSSLNERGWREYL